MVFRFTSFGLIAIVFYATFATNSYAHEITTIRITANAYTPNTIEIHEGDTVVFINDDKIKHWPASDVHPTHSLYPGSDIRLCDSNEASEIFDACHGLKQGEEFRFIFKKAGTWRFHDHLHSELDGSIIVAPSSNTATNTSSQLTAHKSLDPYRKFFATVLRAWYALFWRTGAQVLDTLDVVTLSKNDQDLEYWMRVFGYSRLLDSLTAQSGVVSEDPGTEYTSGQCHTEAHFLGRVAYGLHGNALFNESTIDTRCAFGFYHGVLETALGNTGDQDSMKAFVQRCESHTNNPIQRIFCEHVVGHGLMVYHNYDLPLVLRVCHDLFDTDRGTRMCYHGAFMENVFASLEIGVPNHETIWIDPSRPEFPCTSNALPNFPFVQEQCYINQSIFWARPLTKFNARAAFDGCMRTPASLRAFCSGGIGFNMLLLSTGLNVKEIVTTCEQAPNKDIVRACLVGAGFMKGIMDQDPRFSDPTICSALKMEATECGAFVMRMMNWVLD
mgnify:CR=1 FL=1